MKMFFGNNQQCYGLNISCTPSTLYLTLIRLICLCLCLFMSVPMSVFVCVCFQSDECGVHNCIIAYLTHIGPMNLLLQFTATFPSLPLRRAPRSQKINQHSGCKYSNRNIDISIKKPSYIGGWFKSFSSKPYCLLDTLLPLVL